MKLISICIVLFLSFSFVSCKNQKNGNNSTISNEKLIEIPVREDLSVKDNSIKDYSNLIDEIEVIKLETNANSLFGNIRKIEFTNNRFYILTDEKTILIFDKNGSFIDKLDKRGKGMGEYIEIKDFFICNDNSIKILSYNTIITYDSTLKYINSERIKTKHNGKEIIPIHFLPIDNFTYIFVGSFGINNLIPGEEKALYCIDKNMKIVSEYFPVTSKYTAGHRNFYKSNEITYFTNTYGNDTIYQIQDNNLIPKILVDFFEKKITTVDMLKNRDIFYETYCSKGLCGNLMNIYENNNFICFLYAEGNFARQGLYNKQNKELKILSVSNNYPFPKIVIEGVVNDHFFTTIEPFLILNNPVNRNYNDFIKKYNLTDIKETDNPIIVMYKFKSFS